MKGKIYMKKLYSAIISICCITSCINMYAQGRSYNGVRARHNNFYHKVELNYGNLYSFAISSCLTGVVNYLIDDTVFETGFGFPVYRVQNESPYYFAPQNPLGVQLKDLLHNYEAGLKLGYQTYDPRFVNFGICAVASYKFEPFIGNILIEDVTIANPSSIQRALIGGNIMLYLGEMGMSTQVTLEVGLRYSYGLSLTDSSKTITQESLKNGIVSHYAITVGGPGFLQNIKLFADVNHYDLIKNSYLRLSPIYVGFSWTITPQQSDNKW